MKRKSVKSSNIVSIGYMIEPQILEVEFNSGAVYYYKDVGPIEVLELIFADSVGSYFARNIKSKHQFVKGEYSG